MYITKRHTIAAAGPLILIALLGYTLSGPVHAQRKGRPSLREGLEGTARDATLERGSLRSQLEEQGFIALHERLEEYPKPEEYEDVLKVPPPAAEIPTPDAGVSPANLTATAVRSIVTQAAQTFQVDSNMILAMIRVESNFDPYAVSPAGARGLMQLMPGTAVEMGVVDPFDPEQNVTGGAKYFAWMRSIFNDDVQLSLAAYNAGPGNVRKYGGIPPFAETKAYVVKVLDYRERFARAEAEIVIASARPALAPAALPRTQGEFFTIRLANGFTQPAEVLVESDGYYLSQFRGHASRIPRNLVQDIVLTNVARR